MRSDKLRILSVFGTRPEAVKMAPVIQVLNQEPAFEHKVCVTAQHRGMLDQVLQIFNIRPDYDLDIFMHRQTLTEITMKSMRGLESVIEDFHPNILLVQGDTTTVFAAALAGFYHKVKIGHIEAGLRSGNLYSPYPEEANRKMTGVLADFHFAPTVSAKMNLMKENFSEDQIFVTGNTVIDALLQVVREDYQFENHFLNSCDFVNKKVILLTSHRRENIGDPMRNIFSAVKQVAEENEEVEVIYPVHLNPKVREIAREIFGDADRIHLIEPVDYLPFANLIARCYLVVTDSGGIQEEAPSLGKPVLVVREETERPEGIEAGTAKLAGTNQSVIYNMLSELIKNQEEYDKMANAVNPYGDGRAAMHIRDILLGLNHI
ncbi:MAG: UDP-N-acetylglucosamine 2-epimerase (non-hydrolyzing) [Tissierellales bacterium]|nr:UDP-N-acetylglucosamine 2-epimerase (non-hydrolyzing) [Tissierellales bacterium]MBN2828549.1 UDP-N-acetylglucosamine 2-epimerase (non-hydrolyzing) [Tissierellales bacterium]